MIVALEAGSHGCGVTFHVLTHRSGETLVHEALDQAEAVR
jgi:hypothetical protein